MASCQVPTLIIRSYDIFENNPLERDRHVLQSSSWPLKVTVSVSLALEYNSY